ncbi:MAG: toll/interleukin-1 receptor domain-containing protein, partial [Hyphomicrobium sp.]
MKIFYIYGILHCTLFYDCQLGLGASFARGDFAVGYVFVSHADEDKPRIAPFLRLLKAAGLKLWIDRGHELGNDFTADSGLRLGDAWPASISRALEEAGCILVFWSALSVDPARRVLHNEANTGLRQDKLVQVTLDRDVHNKLHAVFSELQSEKLFAVNSHEETVFAAARVAKAAYGRISEARRRKLEIAGGVPASLLPYVIDRHPQVDRVCADIALNLRLAASQGPSTRTPSRSAYL